MRGAEGAFERVGKAGLGREVFTGRERNGLERDLHVFI
jgi:hypothetical protein